MNESIILQDGTVYADSQAYEGPDGLYIIIKDVTDIVDVFNSLANPEKSAKIVYKYYKAEPVIFEGYTKISSVVDYGSMITVMLKKTK